jgi:ATP-dependent RNA helicase RhlE
MKRVSIESATIHSDKNQQERSSTMTQFSSGQLKLLIATDVSARGIDIPNVDFVVNYDLPDVAENYVHRIGRTGRGIHKGNAISFCSEEEKEMLQEIETYIGKNITTLDIAPEEYEETIVFSDDKQITWKDIYKEMENAELDVLKKRKKKN